MCTDGLDETISRSSYHFHVQKLLGRPSIIVASGVPTLAIGE